MHLLFVQIVKWIFGFRKWFFAKCICKEFWMHIWVEFMMHRMFDIYTRILKCDLYSKTTWDSLRNIFNWNVLPVGEWQQISKRTCNGLKDLTSSFSINLLDSTPLYFNCKFQSVSVEKESVKFFDFFLTDFNKVFD